MGVDLSDLLNPSLKRHDGIMLLIKQVAIKRERFAHIPCARAGAALSHARNEDDPVKLAHFVQSCVEVLLGVIVIPFVLLRRNGPVVSAVVRDDLVVSFLERT